MRQPRQQRSAARVEAILAAARDLLQRNPADAVTTSSIAEKAGIPVSALYRWFDDVDDIVDVLVGEHAHAASMALDKALDTPSTSVAEAFARVLDAHLDLYRSRPDLTRVWFSPQLATRQADLETRADRELARRVGEHLVASGLIPFLDSTVATRLQAHWLTAGALLGALLDAPRPARDDLEAELRALVTHLATRY
jgi:AcrR family transcriptional regulator